MKGRWTERDFLYSLERIADRNQVLPKGVALACAVVVLLIILAKWWG